MFSEIFIFLFMKCFSFPLFDEAPVEAATGSVLQKKLILKISQHSQENNCDGISF